MLLEPESVCSNILDKDMILDDFSPFSESNQRKSSPKDCIQRASRNLAQALLSMEEVVNHQDTPDDVKKNIDKIIQAFSIDQRELDRIVKMHYK